MGGDDEHLPARLGAPEDGLGGEDDALPIGGGAQDVRSVPGIEERQLGPHPRQLRRVAHETRELVHLERRLAEERVGLARRRRWHRRRRSAARGAGRGSLRRAARLGRRRAHGRCGVRCGGSHGGRLPAPQDDDQHAEAVAHRRLLTSRGLPVQPHPIGDAVPIGVPQSAGLLARRHDPRARLRAAFGRMPEHHAPRVSPRCPPRPARAPA